MLDTILFDLDGTLLPINTEEFTKRYFGALSIKLRDYFTADEIGKAIWSSTNAMIQNLDANKTNQDVFFEVFSKQVKPDIETLLPIFDDFYENEFIELQKGIDAEEAMIKSVKILKEKGYDLIIATNPLFPRVAVEERIKWAGLDQDDFSFITSYEIMHYCKPQIEFYEEVLEKTNKKPSQSVMVGNDVKEDMIIKGLGVETYLIEDHIIGDLSNKEQIDQHGNYDDFYNYCVELPTL